jgi:hypothetical protein
MELDTGLSQGVTGMHLLPPGLAVQPPSTGLPAGFEARQVPVSGMSESDDDDSPRSVTFTATMPDDQRGGRPDVLWLPATSLSHLVETAVFNHFEVVQAAQALRGSQVGLISRERLLGWPPLLRALQGLAFAPEAADHWHCLGIVPMEGPTPSEALIEQRAALARLLLSAATTATWPTGDCKQAAEADDRLEQARRLCLDDLREVLRRRPKKLGFMLPRWMELGKEALQLMHAVVEDEGRVATQWSSILGTELAPLPGVMPPELARPLATSITHGGVEALIAMQHPAVMLWAPADLGVLGRLLAAYVQYVVQAPRPGNIHLLIPLEVWTGCGNASAILDLWGHPVLSEKWRSVVRMTRFTSQPLEIVRSTASAPATVWKTLLVATLSAVDPYALPSMISVAEPLFKLAKGKVLVVDLPADLLTSTRKKLADAVQCLSVAWADPVRSPAFSQDAPRLLLRGALPPGAITALDMRMLIGNLRALHLDPAVVLGSDDLFGDNASLLAEFSEPSNGVEIYQLCEDAAFLSPSRMILRTMASPEIWESKVEHMFAENPSSFVSRVRWKPSRCGGRTFAQPAATGQQLGAARREATRCTAVPGKPIQAMVQVRGPVGHDGGQVTSAIVECLRSQGVSLEMVSAVASLNANEWQTVVSYTSNSPTGTLRLAVMSEAEMRIVRDTLHERAIQLGSDLIAISVQDDAGALAQAKNGRRSTMNRSRAAAASPPAPPAGL